MRAKSAPSSRVRYSGRTRRLSLLLGLSIAVSLLAVVGADILLRVVGYAPDISHGWLARSDLVHHRLPSRETILLPAAFVEHSLYEVPSGRRAVVVLGDSFAKGYPVASKNSFPAVLQRLFDRDGDALHVINMGFGDSAPGQQLRLFESLVLPAVGQPSTVVWTLYDNDVAGEIFLACYGIEDGELVPLDTTDHWLYQRQVMLRSVSLPAFLDNSPVWLAVLRAFEVLGGVRHGPKDWDEAWAWATDKLRLQVDRMEQLAALHGFETYYVIIPPQRALLDELPDGQTLAGHLALIELLSLRDDVLVVSTDLDDYEPEGGRDLSKWGDRHLQEKGYEKVARQLHAFIDN